ncbi:SCO family protein [Geomobilimonas luticola]|uniref:SCO family protein n=1 Tax=Geomobilimonas luticola TaxID=1114878 RepID=A0ABS5SBA4_9BACT|nr:SCO family protein [Geomobilimonas luticola]MBT0651917.1 SCO family protein [Geomobilimonas luticola]
MGRQCGTGWHVARTFLASLLVLCAFLPVLAAAHTEDPFSGHDHAGMVSGPDDGAKVGLTERLGEKIPLDLTFRDETGKPVRLGDLVTVPTVILPVYYSCTNVCNFLQQGLASALPGVKRKPGEEYRVISVSFDETETPELAAKYKRMYLTSMNAPFPEEGWRFLTGDAESVRRLTAAAGYRFQRKGRDFIHPVASMVVAPDGTIVRYLYGTTFLPKDLTLALLEAREGKVGTTIRKVVGYCFTFDPEGKTYVFNLLRVSATVVILCTGGFLAFLLLTGRKNGRQ